MTDWAQLDQRRPNRSSVSNTDRETIQQIVEETIISTDHDPDVVLNAAAQVMGRGDVVENLRAYAKTTIGRAVRRITAAKAKKDPLADPTSLDFASGYAANESIENAILVRELLDRLAPLDRDIFERRLEGETFPEIDIALRLKPRTAEFRFHACKTAIRETLSRKIVAGKSLRVR